MNDKIYLIFQQKCNETKPEDLLMITGGREELGNWKPNNNILYTNKEIFPLFKSNPISIPYQNKLSFEYKYCIKLRNGEIRWENFKGNRKIEISDLKSGIYIIKDENFNDNSKPHKIIFQSINIEKGNNNSKNKKQKDNEIENIELKKEKNKLKECRIGLENIGASDYMNSTLQCFCHIKEFIDYFKGNSGKINDKKTLSYSFKLLIEELWPDKSDAKKYYSPYEMKAKISDMNPLFKGIFENDPKDLVNFIIMKLHDELNLVKNHSLINNEKFLDKTNEKLVFEYFIQYFKMNHQSIISDLFYGCNKSLVMCNNCKKIIYDYQIFYFLNFHLEEVRKFKAQQNNIYYYNKTINNDLNEVNIYDCFNYDRKINYMTGENKIFCNFCKSNQDCQVKTELVIGPEILIILLNKEGGLEFNVKIKVYEIIDLHTYFDFKDIGCIYELIEVLAFVGQIDMGHFISFCKDPVTGKWLKLNDAIVEDVNDFGKEAINFSYPYLLFYKRKKK